jgi:hypothetical protein
MVRNYVPFARIHLLKLKKFYLVDSILLLNKVYQLSSQKYADVNTLVTSLAIYKAEGKLAINQALQIPYLNLYIIKKQRIN